MEIQKLTSHVAPLAGLGDKDLQQVMSGNLLSLLQDKS